ncbi:MAG TPA: response regulator, partial [Vicinamibacterales bacterium]|nr:response regulator [Vicinamibacterales bacterium]
DRSGFGVLDDLAARPELGRPAVIMLTSSHEPADAERARAFGVAAYLPKPVSANELRAVVAAALDRAAAAPLLPAPASRPAATSRPDTDAPARVVRVLLAEDNPVNQLVAERMLRSRGHDVTIVGNGVEALAALDRASFDVVLMDLQMPEMGGLEAVRLIRAAERERGTPRLRVVAMTAHALPADRREALAAGMDDYLTKPVVRQQLMAMVERSSDPPADAGLLTVAMLETFGGESDLMREMAGVFVEVCPRLLDRLGRAIASRDAAVLTRAAEDFARTIGQFGLEPLAPVARAFEEHAATGDFDAAADALQRLEAVLTPFLAVLEGLGQPSTTPSTTDREP